MTRKEMFSAIYCMRLGDGRDPFFEYQNANASKRWLIERIVEEIVTAEGRALFTREMKDV